MLKLLALCGLTAAISAVAAVPASATPIPVTLTFHNVVMDTAALGGVAVVTPSGTPLTVNANVTPTSATTADYTITGWNFPTYNFTKDGLTGTIDVAPNTADPEQGTVNFATGAVTMSVDLQADVTITGVGPCTVDTGQLSLSTATTQPLLGKAFPAGESGVLGGNGALGVGWSSLPTPSGSGCPVISSFLSGAGGIWLSGTVTPPAVKVTASKIKTVKARKTAKVKITLANKGGDATGVEKVCLKAPKGVKPRSACKTITNIAGGKSAVVTFKVKATKKKTKKYTLKLTVTPSARALMTSPPFSKNLVLKVKK